MVIEDKGHQGRIHNFARGGVGGPIEKIKKIHGLFNIILHP